MMDDSRQYRIYPNELGLRRAYAAVYEHLERCGYKEHAESCAEIGFTVRLSDDRSLRTGTVREFLVLLEQHPSPESIWTHCHWRKRDSDIRLTLGVRRSCIDVSVQAEDLTTVAGLHDKIAEIFEARNPAPDKAALSRYNLKPTVFLAHRFDEQGRQYARSIERFLRRLGFEVIEGEGYEARDIPAKVAERIRSQDIFVAVVSEGDSSWILSETAFAKGLSKYIVLLVEEGLPLKKGVIGADYEHMSFPRGCIEKTYSDLLYALPQR